jgi:hypothetical protein
MTKTKMQVPTGLDICQTLRTALVLSIHFQAGLVGFLRLANGVGSASGSLFFFQTLISEKCPNPSMA